MNICVVVGELKLEVNLILYVLSNHKQHVELKAGVHQMV